MEYARTIGPDVVIATLKDKELITDYGATQRITALFALKDKSPIENLDVLFQFRRKDGDAWSDLSTVKTSKDGAADIDLVVGGSIAFRAITAESWERMASETEIGRVKVTRSLSVKAPTNVKLGQPLEILAQVAPREGLVTLQVKAGSSWRDLDSGAVSELNGGQLFLVYPKERGFMTFRVRVADSEKYNGSQGEPFTVLIR